MKKIFCLLACAAALVFASGCSTLVPKRVEFFQDKVEKFPEARASEKETQRQAAELAAKRADDALVAAVSNDVPPSVIEPAKDTAVLTREVSRSLGPAKNPWQGEVQALADKLDKSIAALNRRLDSFKQDNNENTGKKIEGTGLFQVPYFVWLGGFLVAAFFGLILLIVLWHLFKIYSMTNPGAAVGVGAVEVAASTVRKGFSQLVAGGEKFKDALTQKYGPEIADEIKSLFDQEHQKAQDADVQASVSAVKS